MWAGRNPGTPVNYNVNWTYGGDGSKPNGGFAAIHGCRSRLLPPHRGHSLSSCRAFVE